MRLMFHGINARHTLPATQTVRDLEVELEATRKQVELTLSSRQEAEVLADLEFQVCACGRGRVLWQQLLSCFIINCLATLLLCFGR